MGSVDDFENLEDLIPPGCVPITGLRIASFLSEDGKMKFNYDHVGEGTVINLIGIMDLIRHDISDTAIKYSRSGGVNDDNDES